MSPNLDTPGFVYFIEATGINRIKIGFTTKPPEKARLFQLEETSPVPLKLLGYIPGTLRLEKSIHGRFTPYRVWGKWFDGTSGLREFISENPDLIIPEIERIRRRAAIMAEVASLVDSGPTEAILDAEGKRKKRDRSDRLLLMFALRDKGWSMRRIGNALGVSATAVFHTLNAAGEKVASILG